MKKIKLFINEKISKKKEIQSLIENIVDVSLVESIEDNTLVIEEDHSLDWKYILQYGLDENFRFVFFNEFIEDGLRRDEYIASGIYYTKEKGEPYVDFPVAKYKNNIEKLSPVLFLDRDGIINHDTGYVYEYSDSIIFKDIIEVVKLANSLNIPVVVVTNQAGVARDMYSLDDVNNFHNKLSEFYVRNGAKIDHIEFCPFHKDKGSPIWKYDSLLRKPNPGMFLKSLSEVHGTICNSLMVGDKESDRINLTGLDSFLLDGNYEMASVEDVCRTRQELCDKISKYLNNLLDLS